MKKRKAKVIGSGLLSIAAVSVFVWGQKSDNVGMRPLTDQQTIQQASASARGKSENEMLRHNYDAYIVKQNGRYIADYENFSDAVGYAKQYGGSAVYFKEGKTPVWINQDLPSRSVKIDAPLINQMPELPRGCEVTSLAMMLLTAGVEADKMRLAEEIRRDPTAYRKENGVVYFGNPYDGFVGDMYSFDKPGYGVYHDPIRQLAEAYLPGRIIDMTGSEFEDILQALDRGSPVWVISNSWFSRLPDSQFQTWQTPTGPVQITYREHSVLITGYDETHVYFNDPLATIKDRKIKVESFEQAWIQMGRQAITYF